MPSKEDYRPRLIGPHRDKEWEVKELETGERELRIWDLGIWERESADSDFSRLGQLVFSIKLVSITSYAVLHVCT